MVAPIAPHLAAASTAKVIRVSVSIATLRSKPPNRSKSRGISIIANSKATAPLQFRTRSLRALAREARARARPISATLVAILLFRTQATLSGHYLLPGAECLTVLRQRAVSIHVSEASREESGRLPPPPFPPASPERNPSRAPASDRNGYGSALAPAPGARRPFTGFTRKACQLRRFGFRLHPRKPEARAANGCP
jgi:hypothetical protein